MIRVEILAATLALAEELAATLAADERLEVVQARAASRPFRYRRSVTCDVLLLAGVPFNGDAFEGPPVVVLSEESVRNAAARAEAHALLPMNASTLEIAAAIIAAASGFYLFTREQLPPSSTEAPERGTQEKLTRRELEVLRMMADGLSNKEIAGAIGVSDHTAKFHVSQVLAKLNVASRTEAVRAGIRRGMIAI